MDRIPILDCVPGPIKLRQQQVDALKFIEENYDKYRFLCLDLPVGAGKSWVATTYNNWITKNNLGKCADVTPTKMLQDQYTKDFDWIPDLKGMNSYTCCKSADGTGSCADYKRLNHDGKLCGGADVCTYMAARADTTSSKTAIYNFYSYFYNKTWENKDHLVIDEGHNTRTFLEGLYTINLWGCELGFDNTYPTTKESIAELLGATYGRAVNELTEAIAMKLNSDIIEELDSFIKQIQSVSAGLNDFGTDILIVKKEEQYNKRKWLRKDMKQFKDTTQTVIRIKPLKVSKIAHDNLWVPEIKKVLFLSATIGATDMIELGITEDMVACFSSDSPIPAEQRKFISWPVASMNYKNQKESLPKILAAVKTIMNKNKDTKGLIHCTYEVARYLEREMKDSRFIFHTTANKNEIYHKFRASKTPKVLIACGMSEGIDLPDDLARWQIILKVQYPSLQDDVWAWKCYNNQKAYTWETIKTIIQQSGRICRGPTDRGFTYMLDAEFDKLWKRGLKWGMWRQWFQDAYVEVKVPNENQKT